MSFLPCTTAAAGHIFPNPWKQVWSDSQPPRDEGHSGRWPILEAADSHPPLAPSVKWESCLKLALPKVDPVAKRALWGENEFQSQASLGKAALTPPFKES